MPLGQCRCYPPGAMPPAPLLSVVVPVRNEGANILPLVAEIRAAVAAIDALAAAEIVYVDDGSTDDTAAHLAAAAGQPGAPLIQRRHRGAAARAPPSARAFAPRAGHGSRPWTATGRTIPRTSRFSSPAPERKRSAGRGPVLVAGHRVTRRDTWAKRTSSRVANQVRAGLLGDATPDTGCGLKVFRREVFLELPHFDHMHRFLPALVLRAGGRVVSVPVRHRPRLRGRSNYGVLDRLWAGVFDLAGVLLASAAMASA